MGFDKVFVHIIEEYYLTGKASWADDDLLDRLKNRVNQIKPGLIGNQAPSLSLVDTEMNPLDLEHIQAKFIVLYFYDHDCGHCKKKTPLLLSQYSSLKEIDVEVIAVDISTDFEKWKGYVSSNNLTFLNGADPYVRSNFRYEYDIRTTPTVYILDENKTIVGKKIDVEKIPDFINYLSRNN
jgi:peroxiredoxin